MDEIYIEDDLEVIIEGGSDGELGPVAAVADSEDDRNSHSEAEEDQPRRVDPNAEKKARVVKNPRYVLNPARLTGPRGINTVERFFKDFKFKGKDHEKEDLDMVMKKLEHWAHRLYPKFQFDDCLDKISQLGHKKVMQVHMRKIRLNMIFNDDDVVLQQDSDVEDEPVSDAVKPSENANVTSENFDALLEEEIVKKKTDTDLKGNRSYTQTGNNSCSTPNSAVNNSFNNISRPVQTPVQVAGTPKITDEQKQRMLKNKMLAEERRLARMKENIAKEKCAQEEATNITTTEMSRKQNEAILLDGHNSDTFENAFEDDFEMDIEDINLITSKTLSGNEKTNNIEKVNNPLIVIDNKTSNIEKVDNALIVINDETNDVENVDNALIVIDDETNNIDKIDNAPIVIDDETNNIDKIDNAPIVIDDETNNIDKIDNAPIVIDDETNNIDKIDNAPIIIDDETNNIDKVDNAVIVVDNETNVIESVDNRVDVNNVDQINDNNEIVQSNINENRNKDVKIVGVDNKGSSKRVKSVGKNVIFDEEMMDVDITLNLSDDE